VQINDLRIEGGVLRFADNLRDTTAADADKPKRVSLALQDIELFVKDFALQKPKRFPVRLQGQFAQGGMLAFDGTLQLLPTVALESSVSIDELALPQVEPYLRQFADVRLIRGCAT
jgi:hypothetical protein